MKKSGGASKGLAITALIVGALGLIVGLVSLGRRRSRWRLNAAGVGSLLRRAHPCVTLRP